MVYIPLGMKHRRENHGNILLETIEVRSGSYRGEENTVDFKDRYNRL